MRPGLSLLLLVIQAHSIQYHADASLLERRRDAWRRDLGDTTLDLYPRMMAEKPKQRNSPPSTSRDRSKSPPIRSPQTGTSPSRSSTQWIDVTPDKTLSGGQKSPGKQNMAGTSNSPPPIERSAAQHTSGQASKANPRTGGYYTEQEVKALQQIPPVISSPERLRKAERAHKQYGFDKYPKSTSASYSIPNMAAQMKKHDESRHRVAIAKSLASPGESTIQPMKVDKLKKGAKAQRMKVDKAVQKWQKWDGTVSRDEGISHTVPAAFITPVLQHNTDRYVESQQEAAKKAEAEKRWGDVARHEQSAARAGTRAEVHKSRLKVMSNAYMKKADETRLSASDPERAQIVQASTRNFNIANGERHMATIWHSKSKQYFSGSDSDEDAQTTKNWRTTLEMNNAALLNTKLGPRPTTPLAAADANASSPA